MIIQNGKKEENDQNNDTVFVEKSKTNETLEMLLILLHFTFVIVIIYVCYIDISALSKLNAVYENIKVEAKSILDDPMFQAIVQFIIKILVLVTVYITSIVYTKSFIKIINKQK